MGEGCGVNEELVYVRVEELVQKDSYYLGVKILRRNACRS